MRGRDLTDDTDDERIINADGDASDYLKAVLDAEWRRDRSSPSTDPE